MKLMCHVFTTLDCNLDCKFCYVDANRKIDDGNNRLVEIAKYLNNKEVAFIHIEGGEPFINDNLFDFLSVSEHNESTSIVTNATCLADGKLNKVFDFGIRKFVVSVDGLRETHNYIRGNDCFDKVVSSIQLLKKYNFDIAISQTLFHDNIHQMKKVVQYFSDIGVKKFRFGDVLSLGRAEKSLNNFALTKEDYSFILEEFSNIIDNFEIDVNLSIKGSITLPDVPDRFIFKNYACSNNGLQLAFMFNGDCYSCSNMVCHDDYLIGNIKNEHCIDNYLNKAEYKECIINCKGHVSISL